MASKKNRSRKSLAVALAIVGVAGLSMASAAQLTVNSDEVVAGVDTFAACDNSVNVHYTNAYDSATKTFPVSAVVVDGLTVDACTGKTVTVSILRANGTVLASATSAAIGATDTSVTIAVTGVTVETVYGAAVQIG
jgi:alpha-tubulin suppressor-like RCC1 family protein